MDKKKKSLAFMVVVRGFLVVLCGKSFVVYVVYGVVCGGRPRLSRRPMVVNVLLLIVFSSPIVC